MANNPVVTDITIPGMIYSGRIPFKRPHHPTDKIVNDLAIATEDALNRTNLKSIDQWAGNLSISQLPPGLLTLSGVASTIESGIYINPSLTINEYGIITNATTVGGPGGLTFESPLSLSGTEVSIPAGSVTANGYITTAASTLLASAVQDPYTPPTGTFTVDGNETITGNLTVSGTLTSAQVIGTGSSFPSSPVDGQIFWRTDRYLLYYWEASLSLWLSVQEYIFDGPQYGTVNSAVTVTQSTSVGSPQQSASGKVLITTFQVGLVGVATANSPGNTWVMTIETVLNGNITSLSMVTAGVGTAKYFAESAINYTYTHASDIYLDIVAVKTGAPGTLSFGASIGYRLIG